MGSYLLGSASWIWAFSHPRRNIKTVPPAMPLTPSIEDSSYSPQFSSTPSDVTIQRFFPQPSPKSKPPASYIPFLDRLRALPELRPIPWRPGQELPRERSFDSPRVQQRGATLLSTRGAIASAACEHCSSGYGRFGLCVTLPQWFQGACSSWIFTSKGNRCSLRTQISGSNTYCRDERLQVIDTLPTATQRQVYSIINGLQGSIDHLQKQLDALKRLMGMNEENRMP
ncbi:unnamed protein product [Diplocarpon coronariae]